VVFEVRARVLLAIGTQLINPPSPLKRAIISTILV
jgi:hypothetical protein